MIMLDVENIGTAFTNGDELMEPLIKRITGATIEAVEPVYSNIATKTVDGLMLLLRDSSGNLKTLDISVSEINDFELMIELANGDKRPPM